MPIKIKRKDRLSSEELNDMSLLLKEKYFCDENVLFSKHYHHVPCNDRIKTKNN